MPTPRQWLTTVGIIALILIPVAYFFWRRWDRPSKAAVDEMKRRKEEREVREMFIEAEAQAREAERLAAEAAISRAKAQAPPPVAKEVLDTAFGSLGNEAPPVVTTEVDLPQMASLVGALPEDEDDEDEDEEITVENPIQKSVEAAKAREARPEDDDWFDTEW